MRQFFNMNGKSMQDICKFIVMYYKIHHDKGKKHTFEAFKGILGKQAIYNTK